MSMMKTFGDNSGMYSFMLQNISVSVAGLSREELFTLGKRGPYYRFLNFPVELSRPLDELLAESGNNKT